MRRYYVKRCYVERCDFGSRVNACRCPDRRLLNGAKRPYPCQCRCKIWLAGNLDSPYFAKCDIASRRSKGSNPVALTDQNLLNGVDLYAQNCAVCHGSASGDASSSPIAKGLY